MTADTFILLLGGAVAALVIVLCVAAGRESRREERERLDRDTAEWVAQHQPRKRGWNGR